MEERWTIREVLSWTCSYFRRAGIAAARFEAEILLAQVLNQDRLELYLHPDRRLTPEQRTSFRRLVKLRHGGTPLQYLTGAVEFYNCRLRVNGSALIPRPETEQLVERVLTDRQGQPLGRTLDLGTGTGAIAIALALACPEAQLTACDSSVEALELAQENAMLNGVAERIVFQRSDWFAQLSGRFDLIISNPPYVSSEELAGLAPEVRCHEPTVALDGGADGLECLRAIIAQAPCYLNPGGQLYLEIGFEQAEAVQRLLEASDGLSRPLIGEDLTGLPRFACAQRAESLQEA
ncbi:MAG TPA: peptide chain release factor N(5)-glutamine methyltransferase [Candidatus Fraserbacteria bacterium]|nr:peptide chain release factor N(5)-glutamine methyltransferase [Candidatus Fraserbacteria bacterium]